MANQLHHIEQLISDTAGRDYATSPGEAIQKFKKEQEIMRKDR